MSAVRHASLTDAPRLIELARKEHAMSRWAAEPFDETHVAGLIGSFLQTIGCTVLMSAGGYFAGLVQHMGFTRKRIAVEFAWFAEDGSGFALLRAFEAWALRMNVHSVLVHSYIEADDEGRLARALTRRHGYSRLGPAFIKAV